MDTNQPRTDTSATGTDPNGRQEHRIYVDVGAFCAQPQQHDSPEKYPGEPIAVGGNPARGVVRTATRGVHSYNVRSAQPAVETGQKCTDLIFVSSRIEVYQKESRRIRAML